MVDIDDVCAAATHLVKQGLARLPRVLDYVRCVGAQQPLSKLTDLMRNELCQAGWTEALTFALCSHDEAFRYMRREDDGQRAAAEAAIQDQSQVRGTIATEVTEASEFYPAEDYHQRYFEKRGFSH